MKWRNFLQNYLDVRLTSRQSRSGVEECCLAFPVLRAVLDGNTPLVVTLPDAASVERLAAELAELQQLFHLDLDTLLIPESGRGKLLFPGGESRRARALNLALGGKFRLAIGSVHALLGPAPPPDETRAALLTLKQGMTVAPEELARKLVTLDYDDEFEATVPGEFARRGGILDIYSPAHDFPCRIEFFGDEIDSLRSFDPATQRSTGVLAEYRIIGRAGITAGGAAESDVFAYWEGLDYRLLVVFPAAGADRLRRFSVLNAEERFDEVTAAQRRAGRLIEFYDTAEGALHPEALPADVLPRAVTLTPGSNAGPEETGAIPRLGAELRGSALRIELAERIAAGTMVVLLADHPEDLPLLRRWAKELGLPVSKIEFDTLHLAAGIRFPGALELVCESELAAAGFHRAPDDTATGPAEVQLPEEERPRLPEFSLADLDAGDLAVHLDHGIGIFRGIQTLSSNGVEREMLALEYQEGRILYVPLLQANKVSRYLGAVGKVKLHAIGGSRWNRDRERAQRGVRSYAADMLRMQAMRNSSPGICFGHDTAETRAFLRAFPYKDTPDQLRSTDEIRRDMQSSRPMDRLLCGDVGYGKTELAMRAAFRAVSHGYQVAVLAPTTVLVQQHLRSFTGRFAEYPYNIAMLSRVCSAAEQQAVMSGLRNGSIDIVIGTHRLCSEQIVFRNLGLVIIDEEQRFGVEHKERLRRFRAEVDVLTMSATPIPRTLYLAMAGARDLSTLLTAPAQRLPVKTVVAPEDDQLVATAIRTELARGGQVYYLHNRVRTIDDTAAKLAAMLPGARIAVAHGQMPEHELEEVMSRFLAGSVDCLVCSTIIESGLDVPNANTIIIEHAERFGLSELYQLRGRVGRWKQQAYAYMLLPRNQLLGSDARKRLAAIRRCSTLGAGIQLAIHDLEIRGSGNLLGAEQSGHLNAIGFDLYCQLLEHEINALQGKPDRKVMIEADVSIDFVVCAIRAPRGMLAAAIPPGYIGGERLRINAYRRLAALESEREVDDYAAELLDRFGKRPAEVNNLLNLIRLRILAAAANYRLLSVVEGRVTLRNPGGTIYRDKLGRAPVISYRDPPELRILHLLQIMRNLEGNTP